MGKIVIRSRRVVVVVIAPSKCSLRRDRSAASVWDYPWPRKIPTTTANCDAPRAQSTLAGGASPYLAQSYMLGTSSRNQVCS